MNFFYSDDKEPFTGSLEDINWTKAYLNHYDNYLYLNFISTNTKDRVEKVQACKELTICERKLKFAERQGGFNKQAAEEGIFERKRKWL